VIQPLGPVSRSKARSAKKALAGSFNAQDVASTLWAYTTMGREPGAGVMRKLEGRAEAGTFTAQHVANTLYVLEFMTEEGKRAKFLREEH